MSKRYFKIYTGRYGGEVAIGKVTKEFVDYWQDRIEEDGESALIEHVQGVQWQDEDTIDPDSPCMIPNQSEYDVAWHDVDDIEHLNGPYADNEYQVEEIELHPDAVMVDGVLRWREGVDHGYSTPMYTAVGEELRYEYENFVYGREAYTTDPDLEMLEGKELNPVMFFHSSEKGGFGDLFVETDGEDFDESLLAIGVCETNVAEIIEAYWYNGKLLEIDWDYADTMGKAFYAQVGYMNPEWHDNISNYDPEGEHVKEMLEELQEEYDWEEE